MQASFPMASLKCGIAVCTWKTGERLNCMQGHEKIDTPLDVLDALEACAAKGSARALCALAAFSFRAATLLGMTCKEAASLGPRQSLQVLLMKGPQAAPVSNLLTC